jgi:PhnB protein
MKNLNVYLNFPGNCEEALHFYQGCFGGEILSMKRFGDSPMESPEAHKQRIMHAEFKAEGIYFMASDTMPDDESTGGNVVQLSINLTDATEQEQLFKRLSEGGTVLMPLQDTFWGAAFGMLTDKFGIRWMLNRNLEN